MKRLAGYIVFLLLLLLNFRSYGQTYGNEWIDYSQKYYRFEVYQTGIYMLDYNTLVSANIPLATFQTENIQIFGRQKEIPIHIEDGGDSSFDSGDYILFYAERNDGWLDSTIYTNPVSIGNPAYSLYNDTINYFFTWNNSTTNLRYSVETDVNFGAYTNIAPYVLYKTETNYNSYYLEGEKENKVSSSFFSQGEGWSSPLFNGGGNGGSTQSYSLSTPYAYTSGPNAFFHGLSASASNAASSTPSLNHHSQWLIGASNTVILDTTFGGYKQVRCNKDFPASLLSTNTAVKYKVIDDLGALTDYQVVSYYSITYPRSPNFGGSNKLTFKVINDPQGKIRLDVSNVAYSNPIMFVQGDTPRMIPFIPNAAVYSALIPNSTNGVDQTVYFYDSSLVISVPELIPVTASATFTDFASLNLDSALLFVYHSKLNPAGNTAVDSYVSYRQSITGGLHNVVKADVDELYLQFGGGIEKHINGVRRFAHLVYNSASIKPEGLFIIGKGVREASINDTGWDGPGARKDVTRFHMSLIPSFGLPSSDVSITSSLEGPYVWAPLMPTGRISAQDANELNDYLDKVITYENEQDQTSVYNTPNKDWQKHIMHFAGGSDAPSQASFQNFLNSFKSIITDYHFGGYVHNTFKTSSNPLDPTILAGITDRIESGVSLMTYFGHATATNSGFEINLDDPINWNNTGKYPIMLVNSCYNGNIFQANLSKSEEFVQIADYGAIAYIASAGIGLDTKLFSYSQRLYLEMGRNNYGGTLGEHMKNSIIGMEGFGLTFYNETTSQQMVLNGDPMLKLNWHMKPEIELLTENVSFSPAQINLSVDSIEMSIIVTNLGKSITDTILVEVTRDFPGSNTDSLYLFQLPRLHYKDTLKFKMPLQANIGVGINNFTIKVDLPSVYPEMYDEINNNQIVKSLFIDIDGILPVIPFEFAVMPVDSVTVKGSTINPIAAWNTYRFELDTTDAFNSPEHRYAYVSGYGGVKEVNPSDWLSVASGMSYPLVCTDSTVYFWRCAVDSSVFDWKESSFQYIIDKIGWGQDHFFQFKNNSFTGVDYNKPNRTRDFGPYTRQLICDVIASTTGLNIYYNAYSIDAEQQDYGVCTFTPKLHVAVIDPVTLAPWGTRYVPTNQNMNNNFGNNNDNGGCAPRPMKFFTFNQNDIARLDSFENMVLNHVPDSFYILIYSPMTTRYDWWDSIDSVDMYNTFAALGSDSIVPGRINAPFAFFCKKGDTNSVIELFAPTPTDNVHLEATLYGSDYQGTEAAPLIGPSTNWKTIYWKQDPQELNSQDSTVLTVKAYDITGAFQMYWDTVFTANDSIENFNSIIDAAQYPYISLQAYYYDDSTNTPAQVDRWHVLFDPVPEAAIDGSTLYTWSMPDTLEAGQTVDFAVDVKNIFIVDMDSLLINYWIEDAAQMKYPISYPRQDSLKVNEVLRDTITFSTEGLSGMNSFWMEVNPYVNGSLYETDQPEQFHYNNVLTIPFWVNPDVINPILDVTFDGRHILNGDIVNPYSEILITLKDENEFLIMDDVSDTSHFGVYLTDPNGVQTKIPFMNDIGDIVMQWIPADASNKRFKIVWPAAFTLDGTYTLLVQGSDKSGNISGDIEYKVRFEIIHESSITNMMNYPNPFSTSTRFVFTLTGAEVPDDILIQIMTVTGRVVREINENELGQIFIGRNITEYAWDGTDEFGDPLANGVYLYRVIAKIHGEDIKHRDSGADQYFKKDFGKMYLLR